MSYTYLAFVLLSAFIYAKLEIEIEGRQGWAAGLPTWRVENHVLLDLFFGGRPLTGYHVWSFVLFLLLFHMPFFFNGSWSARGELNVLGGYFLFWVVEDFLWFVMNPDFGLSKFNKEYAWWHKRWILGLPLEYWTFGTLALLLLTVP
jgi:hypothetical protein